MPIHDQSYRRYEGAKAPPGRAWLVIAKAGIMTMIRKRLFLGLLIMSLDSVHRAAPSRSTSRRISRRSRCSRRPPRPSASSSTQQDLFVFIMTIYVGAGLIANDRRANALQIYLSKPLLRAEYIAGKAAVLFFFLMLVTLGARHPPAPRAGDVRRATSSS